MKKKCPIVLSLTLLAHLISAQIGIYTENPQATLDVNGDFRIKSVPKDTISEEIIVLNNQNIVNKNSIKNLISKEIVLKSYVKAIAKDSTLFDTIPIKGWYKVLMPIVDFDENNDYNEETSEFKAPETGFYCIYVQLKTSNMLATDEVGVGILKKDGSTSTYSLLGKQIYHNVNILIGSEHVTTSPPTRSTETIAELNKGDVIIFGAKLPSEDLSLVGGASTFCSIYEIKKTK